MKSVYFLQPLNEKTNQWLNENLEVEDYQKFYNGIAVESRYIKNIFDVLINNDLQNNRDFVIL